MRICSTRLVAGASIVIAACGLAAIAAQEPQTAPTFRSAIDLVPVDVSIVDRDGRPVTGLTAADFTLTVDGKPRRIVSAEYVSTVRDAMPAPMKAAAPPTDYSSNGATTGGRLIMFVVDQGNIGHGRGRSTLEGAKKFIERLTPADRVGLVAIPGAGPQIDFTTNHALVTASLSKLVGHATSPNLGQYRIGVAESFRMNRGDLHTMEQVLRRECANQDPVVCAELVTAEARTVYAATRDRARESLLALRVLVDRLSQSASPKTIVLLSEGLIIERDIDELSWLSPATARGQVVIYALQLDEPYLDATEGRPSPTRREDLALAEDGLGMMAGLARGSLMRVVANADAAFNRLALELSGYYMLGFEPEAADRDGRSHRIKVVVQRQGVEVRARAEFAVKPAAAMTAEGSLADVLRAPLLASDIPLKLSTVTLRDPESDKLRILMVTEIDRAQNPDGKLSLAYTLVTETGKLIDSKIDREVKTPVEAASNRQTYTGFILSDASGPHTLKVAVLDDRGRRGSVEHTFRAALTSVGQVRVTDLLIAEHQRADSESATPVLGRELTSGMMHGYIELYSDSTDVLNNATVLFEVAPNEDGRALDGAAGKVQPSSANAPNRRAIEGSIPLALLPPGSYVARAVVMIDGRRAGQVTRPLRVGRTVTAAAKPASPLGLRPVGSKTPIPFTSRIERFDRSAVLTPQVVGFFLERMNFGARGEPDAVPAVEHARAGRFDEAVKVLGTKSGTVPAAFLSGLSLYATGELEAAANKFRETLRLDSEFFPAAFYLGSCYAAGGRDQEAVGAWQLSLVTESDAPFIFTLLGDALLRLREVDHALEILNEAAGVWPDNDEVQVRIGAALAMSGKRADALLKLEPYLAKHPEDVDRHFLALKTLYEARSDGKPIRSQAEDRALFAKWAAAYAAAKGPQLALVEQWQRAINK